MSRRWADDLTLAEIERAAQNDGALSRRRAWTAAEQREAARREHARRELASRWEIVGVFVVGLLIGAALFAIAAMIVRQVWSAESAPIGGVSHVSDPVPAFRQALPVIQSESSRHTTPVAEAGASPAASPAAEQRAPGFEGEPGARAGGVR